MEIRQIRLALPFARSLMDYNKDMCGRYTLTKPEEIVERFDAQFQDTTELRPNYNVSPMQDMPVVVAGDKRNIARPMRWGLVPHWSKEPKIKFSTINARAEGLEDKPVYRGPFKYHRCIVPANGFYEWQNTADGKQPYYIHLKNDAMYGFAGLFDTWTSPDGSELETYTIITVNPNSVLEPIHDRMPAILHKDQEQAWLDPDIQDPVLLHSFLKPYPADQMEAFPVSKAVNNVRNNEVGLIGPINSK